MSPAEAMNTETAEFLPLAQAAFKVMMSRGWFAMKDPVFWNVKWTCHQGIILAAPQNFDDPFTALVAVDKWYRDRPDLHDHASPGVKP